MDLQLKGKCALVTGSSRGLGRAVALALAQEGCQVAVNSRDPGKGLPGSRAVDRRNGKQGHCSRWGCLRPAGAWGAGERDCQPAGWSRYPGHQRRRPPAGTFELFDDAAWQKAIDSSLMSHVRLIKAALPHLRRSKAASVLTITSYSVKQPIPNLVLSNSIRAATVGLTKSLALELGQDGIRFNSILPGWTATERVTELMTSRARQNDTTLEEEILKQSRDSPLGRMGTPAEVRQRGRVPCFTRGKLYHRRDADGGWRNVQGHPLMLS